MIKLVASDLDGTLLNSNHKILQSTKDAIQKYLKLGIHFAFCTGRGYVEMDDILKDMPSMEYAITANGAYCFNTKTKKDMFEVLISKEDTKKIYEILKDKDVVFEIYTDGKIYCEQKAKDKICDYIPMTFHELIKISRTFVEDMESFIDNLDTGIIKIHTFFGSVSARDNTYEEIKTLPYDTISQSMNEIEFSAYGVNKGSGLERLAKSLGIKKDEILALGDNFNDMSMRDSAGILVAMGNAVEPLKQRADFITNSNDDDGIALALDKYLKNQI